MVISGEKGIFRVSRPPLDGFFVTSEWRKGGRNAANP